MKCPICGKPASPGHKPFCSKRCADIDLGHWLTDSYKIPQQPGEDEEEDEPTAPPASEH